MASCRLAWIGAVGLMLLTVGLPARAQSGDTTTVQVRLRAGTPVQSATLTPRSRPLVVELPGGGPALRLRPGDTTVLGRREGDVYVRQGDRGIYATRLSIAPAGDAAEWRLSINEGSARTYTGALRLAPSDAPSDGVLLVNSVPLDDYVASVVASEYGLDDRAGTRAMAVVARTYGLFATEKFGGAYDHADGTASQVYDGAGAITDRARRAVAATESEVLTYDGHLIQAVYFSSSGGHTASNEDVWRADEALPYLRGRRDPYDEASPHHTWEASIDRGALLRALTRTRDASITGFTIGGRARHGRIRTINLLRSDGADATMNANAFRLAVNRGVDGAPLKSTWFDARRQGDDYVFDGRGFGHGVGLSQWGAHAMAEQGHDYRDILAFYYTGVEVRQRDGTTAPPASAPIARSPPPADSSSASGGGRIGW